MMITKGGASMRVTLLAALLVAATPFLLAAPAVAQSGMFSEGHNFLKAVKERDINAVRAALGQAGSRIVNTADGDTGETALHIVTRERDLGWMSLLIQAGAEVNERDREGNTPLIVAVDQRYVDGARLLLAARAKVDQGNRGGETPLIRAVALRDVTMARILVERGANPDVTDNVAGLSARDYATRDRRAGAIAKLFEAPKTAAPSAP